METPSDTYEPPKSEYELQRDARIQRNHEFLQSLGLGSGWGATAEEKEKKKSKPGPKRKKDPPREGERRSSRQRGESAPSLIEDSVGVIDPSVWTPQAARAPRGKRLPDARQRALDAACGESRGPVTAAEAEAVEAAMAALDESSTAPAKQRQALRAVEGLRRPAWLAHLEASSVLSTKSQANADKVMIVLERCAAGIGIGAATWDERGGGSGARMCTEAAPLTLGTDIEWLKYVAKRMELIHGADTSNGWAYTHAWGKLKAYQTLILGEDAFDAPPLSDLDNATLEAMLPEHLKAPAMVSPDVKPGEFGAVGAWSEADASSLEAMGFAPAAAADALRRANGDVAGAVQLLTQPAPKPVVIRGVVQRATYLTGAARPAIPPGAPADPLAPVAVVTPRKAKKAAAAPAKRSPRAPAPRAAYDPKAEASKPQWGSQTAIVAASPSKAGLVGAKLKKRFPGFGVFTGEVVGPDALLKGKYLVEWSDGDETSETVATIKKFLV